MKLPRDGLIVRIALLVVCVEVAGFGALGWFYTSRYNDALVSLVDQRVHTVARMLATRELPITAIARRDLLSGFLGVPYLRGEVIGGSGLVVVSTLPGELGRPATALAGIDPSWLGPTGPELRVVPVSQRLIAIIRIADQPAGPPMYRVVFTISTAGLEAMRRTVALWGLFGSLLFILLTSVGIVLIAQRLITRRVRTSLAVLKRVEQGELDARIPAPGSDELSQLQRGINSMTETVGGLLAQHRDNAAELRRQKDLLGYVIQNAPVRVFWKDRSLRYAGCNELFARDAGLAGCADLIGKTDFDLAWRGHAEAYRADDLAVLQSGQPKLEFEESQTTPDGRSIWLSTSKVPMRDPDGRVAGVLGIYSDITDRKQAEEQIRHLAYFDPITGLPNRRLFGDRLAVAMRASREHRQYGALVMLDLDDFKDLNDTSGHVIGDQLLAEVGQRLRERFGQDDSVARLGGDEYVAICQALGDDEGVATVRAGAVAEDIRQALSEPYSLDGGNLLHRSTVSIGVTLFRGDDVSVDTVLKQADVALNEAKGNGRNGVRFFNRDIQDAIDRRARMVAGLREAVDRGELQVYYQPQVDGDRRLIGAEALLRWFPHGQDPVPPSVFIPLAEDTGLIAGLGAWVFEQACLQRRRWEESPRTRSLVVSVNISAHQLRQPDFVEQVDALIRRAGIAPSGLKLELTESAVLADVDTAVESLRRLRQLGVSFSLDDFGTGYSSLSYLKRLPFDQIKIDQSFVRDVVGDANDAAIVRTIIAMSHSLGIEVIAEGVETDAQLEFLRRYGCSRFQGYLFGRPQPVSEWPAELFADVAPTDPSGAR